MSDNNGIALRRLEDMLAREGLPTFCRQAAGGDGINEPLDEFLIGEPTIELVFPMNKERQVYDFLRRHRPELLSLFGKDFEIYLRTILYHLAYSMFAPLSSNKEAFFLSTNIENLKTPSIVRIRDVLYQYRYSVKEVVVGLESKAVASTGFQELVLRTANDFNKESRYLKISELWITYTISAGVRTGDPPLEYTKLALDESLLTPQ